MWVTSTSQKRQENEFFLRAPKNTVPLMIPSKSGFLLPDASLKPVSETLGFQRKSFIGCTIKGAQWLHGPKLLT